MESIADDRRDMMGEFHNKVVMLIDESKLSPVEITAILRMIFVNTEKLFEMYVKGKPNGD